MERDILELQKTAKRESESKKTILHAASGNGSREQVEYILREFADKIYLVQRDLNEETALHVAAYCGHTEVVKILIDAARHLPTTTSAGDDDPENPISCFEDFIRHPNGRKNTALHLAVSRGNEDCAKLLVEADIYDRHIQNCDGATPLYLAANLGYNDIGVIICKICKFPTFDGPQGRTALHAAIMKLGEVKDEDRAPGTYWVITSTYFVWELMAAFGHSRSALEYESFLRKADSNRDTALYLAVQRNQLEVVDLILEADPAYPLQDKNKNSKTPLFVAAEMGYTHILVRLCETANFGYEITRGRENRTALHVAIIGRKTDCVRALLEIAPRLVKCSDHKGWTPLHYAAYYNYDSILADIVKVQESVDSREEGAAHSRGSHPVGDRVAATSTPHCIAAEEGHTSTLIQLMLSLPHLSADVNDEGQNVLHLAAAKNNKEMVKCILTYSPSDFISRGLINQKDVNGDTPLHLLIKNGCFVPQLINHEKIDTRAKNKQDWTPLDMLYFDEKIVGDQLQIKKSLDLRANQKYWNFRNSCMKVMTLFSRGQSEIQAHQNWMSSRRTSTRGSYTQESVVPPNIRSRKDARFKIEQKRLMKIELSYHKQRLFAQMIVTVLITTVTFTVGFTLPGGYHQSGEPDEGLVVLSKKTAFNVFMIADALALVLSTSSLFIFFIMNMYHDPLKVSMLNAVSTGFNVAAVIAMMLTFMMGTYVVLSHTPALAITVCVIICFFFLLVIVLLGHVIYSRSDSEFEKSEFGKYEV